MILQTSYIGFKSWESPGHSKTNVPLISRLYFTYFGFKQRTLPCIITNAFHILYWYVNFRDLNPIEEVWSNIKRRCESLPINKISPISVYCVEEQILKLYDEMASDVLAEYKTRGATNLL